MDMPANTFKTRLKPHAAQIGLWVSLAETYCIEITAGAGFDWLLLDAEHAPNDLRSLVSQLQVMAAYPVSPVVRLSSDNPVHVKQVLDLGCQTLLVPMIESGEQAAALVRSTRYPPQGIRGVGSALARASRWNRITRYLAEADDYLCVLAQVESAKGLEALDAIADTPGIDGVFIGPADLSASMGFRGQPAHPTVQAAIDEAIAHCTERGTPIGILSADETLCHRYVAMGAAFVAVGADTTLLAKATQSLAARFHGTAAAQSIAAQNSVY